MQDLEKRAEKEIISTDTYYTPNKRSVGAGSFALSMLISGAFVSVYVEGVVSKIGGGLFVAAGVGTLWIEGYSPIKIGKDFLERVGKLACFPYDYIKKFYKGKEEK